MADVYEQNLPSKANLTVNDYIRVVGSDNNSYKQLVSDVAKKIIENYTGSSLAGSSQSVKSALDSLNSNKTPKNDAQQLRFASISSESTATIEELGVGTSPYGSYFIFMRIDSAVDGAYAAFVRHNAIGYQITEIHKGSHANTPYVDSNGVVKTSYATPSTVHVFALRLSQWN